MKRCQSCSIALLNDLILSTNSDGLRNSDYCKICFEGGQFVEPEIDFKAMCKRVESIIASHSKIDKANLRTIVERTVGSLKRWAKK